MDTREVVAQAVLNFVTIPAAFAALAWVVTFLLYAVLFATLYHWLPDGRVPWGTALRGGLMTTALFMVGRAVIGLYLEKSDTAGAFGPAGAVIVWLLWAFYSALIFRFSALAWARSCWGGWRVETRASPGCGWAAWPPCRATTRKTGSGRCWWTRRWCSRWSPDRWKGCWSA